MGKGIEDRRSGTLPAALRFGAGAITGSAISLVALIALSVVAPQNVGLDQIAGPGGAPSDAPDLAQAPALEENIPDFAAAAKERDEPQPQLDSGAKLAGQGAAEGDPLAAFDGAVASPGDLAAAPAPLPADVPRIDAVGAPQLPAAIPSREVLPADTESLDTGVTPPRPDALPTFLRPKSEDRRLAIVAPRSDGAPEAAPAPLTDAVPPAGPRGGQFGDLSPGVGAHAALRQNAAKFEAEPGTPLIGVVLEDAGRGGLDVSSLAALGIPLTVGVVAGREGDHELSIAIREAGHEILAQLPMDGARLWATPVSLTSDLPEDQAAAETRRLMRRLSVAVAASNHRGVNAGGNTSLMRGVIGALARDGYGFLEDRPGSSITVARVAAQSGVAFGETTRFVPAGSSANQAYDVLEVAAREAQDNGAAIVRGPASTAMLEAVLRWALERGSGSARIAPLSAVLAQTAGG